MNPLGPEVFQFFYQELGINTMNELAERIAQLNLPSRFSKETPLIINLLTFYKKLFIASMDPYGTHHIQEEMISWASSLMDIIELPIVEGAEEHFIEGINLPSLKRETIIISYKIPLKEYLSLSLSFEGAFIRNGYVYITPSKTKEVARAWLRREIKEKLEKIRGMDLPKKYFEWYAEEVKKGIPKVDLEVKGLDPEAFPPCIKKALQGVPAGYRNFIISVLLTSFLSYARLNLFGKKERVETEEELRILKEEIVPLIYKAGQKCNPPLFDDRPHEIKSVWFTLGFGYTNNPKVEDSGSSPWYFPPNCEKIRQNAPFLCAGCEGVKNPLTFYLRELCRKRRGKKKENEETVKKPSQNGDVNE